jgi:hypothetical protein
MKQIAATAFLFLLLISTAFCQPTDTLRVLILSPNKVEICRECRNDYDIRNNIFVKNRAVAAAAKRKEKESNIEHYNQQPTYTRKMFENEISFIDSLNLSNYITYATRDFIATRLYRPYKIKPRLVLASAEKLASEQKLYIVKAAQANADFIINFPLIRVEKSKNILKVIAITELYSRSQNAILIHSQSTGVIDGSPTDYPMCEPGQIDCAFINSAYESITKCLLMIAESRR